MLAPPPTGNPGSAPENISDIKMLWNTQGWSKVIVGSRGKLPILWTYVSSGGSKGAPRPRGPVRPKNSSISCSHWEIFGKIVCWCPIPGGLSFPPMGNSGCAPGFFNLMGLYGKFKCQPATKILDPPLKVLLYLTIICMLAPRHNKFTF